MRVIALAAAAVFTAAGLSSSGEEVKKVTPKKQIAVKDFADKSGGSHWWHNAGSGMAEMITTALVKTGKFMVVERKELSGVTEEQALAASSAAAKGTRAQMGKLIIAGLLVYGAITECGVQERSYGAMGVGVKRQTSRLAADVRLVDTTTGEVVKTFKSEGEESASGVHVSPAGAEFGKAGFDETLIGKAARKCIDDIVAQIDEASEKVPWSGKISQVVGGKVYINSGANDGQQAGAVYEVIKLGEEITDPDSGESLGFETSKVGKVKITRVDQKFSVCEGVEGTDFQRGYLVKQAGDSK